MLSLKKNNSHSTITLFSLALFYSHLPELSKFACGLEVSVRGQKRRGGRGEKEYELNMEEHEGNEIVQKN